MEYMAFYKGKIMHVEADSAYKAQKLAAKLMKAKNRYDITVYLYKKDGCKVTHIADF